MKWEVLAISLSFLAAFIAFLLALGKVWQWPEPATTGELIALQIAGIASALGAGIATWAKSYWQPIPRK